VLLTGAVAQGGERLDLYRKAAEHIVDGAQARNVRARSCGHPEPRGHLGDAEAERAEMTGEYFGRRLMRAPTQTRRGFP
jgi:hypothetical protein